MNQSNDIMKVIREDIDVTFDVRGILSWSNNPNRNVMICFEYNSDLRHAGNKNNNLQSMKSLWGNTFLRKTMKYIWY